jgi:hypothetical protein
VTDQTRRHIKLQISEQYRPRGGVHPRPGQAQFHNQFIFTRRPQGDGSAAFLFVALVRRCASMPAWPPLPAADTRSALTYLRRSLS